MNAPRSSTAYAEPPDLVKPGVYLTDGSALFSVLGELPDEPSLCLLEDCRTLEVLVVHVDHLRGAEVREVHATQAPAC
jgi:hypothetical protein